MLRQREHPTPRLILAAVLASGPVAALVLVGAAGIAIDPGVHLVAVTSTALAAVLASIGLTVAGARAHDGSTIVIATAFVAMAALLAVHAFATPGVLVGRNGLVAFAGGATLPVGATIIALASVPALRRLRRPHGLVVVQIVLVALIGGLGVMGMLLPSIVPAHPRPGSPLALAVLAFGLAVFGGLGARALRTYLLTHREADLAVCIGLAWLGTSLASAMLFTFAEFGWWLGHGFELFGIMIVGGAVAFDLQRGVQSRPLAGDLRATELVSTQEVYLGSRVRALIAQLAENDTYLEGHARRVALRAVQIGEELAMHAPALRTLAVGSLLHDMGKLSIPGEVLQKPEALTHDEYELIKLHPDLGSRLLHELGGFSEGVHRLVREHHERLDGSGYPDGLQSEDLSLDVRILAVCDVYDALISNRVYRAAWPHEEAVALLQGASDEEFDDRCVRALQRVLDREHVADVDDRARFLPHPAERYLQPWSRLAGASQVH